MIHKKIAKVIKTVVQKTLSSKPITYTAKNPNIGKLNEQATEMRNRLRMNAKTSEGRTYGKGVGI